MGVAQLKAAYEDHGNMVFRVAFGVLGDGAIAEDVVQEVFLRLWANPEFFDETTLLLRVRLKVLARNRAVDSMRANQARRRREERDAELRELSRRALDENADLANGHTLRTALQRLPDDERQMILLAYFGGLSYRQVAASLRTPEGTVKTKIRAGLLRLRHLLWRPRTVTSTAPRRVRHLQAHRRRCRMFRLAPTAPSPALGGS